MLSNKWLPVAPLRSYPRAVIFDVYQTMVRVDPAPNDAHERWLKLWGVAGANEICPTLDEFSVRCRKLVDAEHAQAKACGLRWPEVIWPDVVAGAFPALKTMEKSAREHWMQAHQACLRTLRPMPGVVELLNDLAQAGACLGIASNAQAYTLCELDGVFEGMLNWREIFDPDLCVWSYACGFSKPDPHIFRMLTSRLLQRGIAPHEILMVGDRLDNDILPARTFGWQTWHLCDQAKLDHGGSAAELRKMLNQLNR